MPICIGADRGRLGTALANLSDNAVRYNRPTDAATRGRADTASLAIVRRNVEKPGRHVQRRKHSRFRLYVHDTPARAAGCADDPVRAQISLLT